ncbi:DNA polymerase/3'-5' exonuclease PolX [Candidatus Daviesbacteria bacterium]|nr:DNA polymerase/3'-5' exonuclease PolX [Candidatus Daviesbacteria bacterium]
MEISNSKIAKILRNVAAAYTIKKIGNFFQIRAYENAADSIEQSTAEVYDLWQEGKLDQIPGSGESIRGYLDELFKTGKVKHFEEIEKGIPKIFFDLLDIPGVGPKTAQKIAELGVKDLEDLKKKLKNGDLVNKGFSSKLAQNIISGLHEVSQRGNRMLLPYGYAQAEKILNYLKKCPDVLQAHPLGSLRRMVATVGDLDFSASSNESKKVVDYFCQMSSVARIVDQGENKATVILQNGIQADLLVGRPGSYGALLQHFTGSKVHNIKLRTLANQQGYSLSEYGVKRAESGRWKVEDGKLIKTETEEEFYKLLGMDVPPPELREDTGEIEVALQHNLPKLVEFGDIKGDLHLHSSFPIEKPSHAPGVDSIEDIIKKAINLGYQYVGISDHSPSLTLPEDKVKATIEKRTKVIQFLKKNLPAGRQGTKSIRVLNGLEIDILGDGSLSVPDEVLETLDYCIAGIHSGHRGHKDEITKRLLAALNNPHVDIISHPTNRLLNERESSEADWETIFKLAAKNNKILEINAYPNRLDLRDDLAREAKKYGVKFIINTDAHAVSQMDNMRFGVAVARRSWAEKRDIVNSWDWKKFAKWFNITYDK